MIFTLEVLQANHGDCLLLHFGTNAAPKLMVIDGGPAGIYDTFLKPRLLAIKQKKAPAKPLTLSMVMVSHLDDDHANGLCMLTDEMVNDGAQSPFRISHLWVNTFDDIIGNNQVPAVASMAASSSAASIASLGLPGLNNLPGDEVAVIASTSQGRQLRNNAKTLTINTNKPFDKMKNGSAVLVRGDTPKSKVPFSGLQINVVSPDETRLEKLQDKWDKDLKKFKLKGDKSILTATIASMDGSPFNLSSIACLVKQGTRTILLTGDGRSDFILEGLENNKILEKGKTMHVNILKMPHHGSIRNIKPDFLQRITADHYVISADGRDNNPDTPLLTLLAKNVTKGTIWFTNESGKLKLKTKMTAFLKKLKTAKSKAVVKFLKPGQVSLLVELDDKINF